MPLKLIDTHAHLQLSDYDQDRQDVVARARATGVERMLIVGTDLAANRLALEMADSNSGLFPTVGWHPHDAKDWTLPAWEETRRQAKDPRVVAVGEVGLDYFKNFSPKDQQERVFKEAIRLACGLNKPLVIHAREAYPDVLGLIKAEGGGAATGVMHCFASDAPTAEAAMGLGFYISFSAVITYPKNGPLREVAKNIPADKLLTETDCPFLPPQDKRGQRNEPSEVRQVVDWLAQLRGTSPENLAGQIWENAERLFGFER